MNKNFEQLEQLFKDIFTDSEFNNHSWYVGGYVRDQILKKDPKDMDIVVDIYYGSKRFANQIFNELGHQNVTTPTRLGHYPIWQITIKQGQFEYKCKKYDFDQDQVIEIAESMSEDFPNRDSRQRNVKFATIEQDVLRRDFSCNSLLKNIITGEIVDFVGGIKDINKGIIKCNDRVDPKVIFDQDPLRMLRLIVFSIRYDWKIDSITKQAVVERCNRIQIVSNERVIKELEKVCRIKHGLYRAVLLMDQLGLLKYVFPDIYHLKTIVQAPDVRKIHLEGSEWIFSNFCG